MELFLPFLMKKSPSAIVDRLGLTLTHSPAAKDGVCVVTHKYSFGCSEVEQIQMLVDGVQVLMVLESMLQMGDITGCSEAIRKLPLPFVGPTVKDPKPAGERH